MKRHLLQILLQILYLLVLIPISLSCAPAAKNVPLAIPSLTASPDSALPKPVTPKETNGLLALKPYFDEVFAGLAAKALAENRLKDARQGFDDIVRLTLKPHLNHRAQFVSAYLSFRLGDNKRVLAEMPPLGPKLPLVENTIWEISGLAALGLKKWDLAVEYGKKMTRNGSLGAMIIADGLKGAKRYAEAESQYKTLISNWPEKLRSREARAKLVECLYFQVTQQNKKGDSDQNPSSDNPYPKTADELATEALQLIDLLQAQAPQNAWTISALKYEDELRAILGKPAIQYRRESAKALEAYDKAASLKRRMKNAAAEKAYAQVIKLSKKRGTLRCKARFEQAHTVERQRSYTRAASLYTEISQTCSDPNIRIKSLYKAAKTCMAGDQYLRAIGLFGQIETDYPDHSYADDARLHAARSYLALGNREKFIEMIISLPDLYPNGDMRAEALWQAAKNALEEKDHAGAKEVLFKYYQLFPLEEGWYTSGRSGYWLGRVEEILGQTEEAQKHYEYVVASSPLSYYMVLAYGRLHALDEIGAESLVNRLAPIKAEMSDNFPMELLEEMPVLATGVEMMRLGLTTRGSRILSQMLDSSDIPVEVHWAVATFFRHQGQYTSARLVSSGVGDGWSSRYPSGADMTSWTLAYPKAFEEAVDNAATESGVDPALLWAVMREESGFNAKIESWANAIGLMQLILPTAKAMGKRIGIKVNRKTLKDPNSNIRLGAAYLAYLSDKFNGHPLLIIAGYNAGEGSVARWLRENPNKNLDHFVEDIPYSQTRGYSKRVLSSYATYKFLYGEDRTVITPRFDLP